MQSIKADEEKEVIQNELTVTLEQIREALDTMREQKEAIEEAIENGKTILKGLDTANASTDNIIKGICSAIVEAENIHIKANLDDESIWQLQELHDQWLEQEKQMLADKLKQQKTLWQKQSQHLTNIVRNNEGIWLSQRLFYIVGSFSLLSIMTLVMEIAFYIYFHWIL